MTLRTSGLECFSPQSNAAGVLEVAPEPMPNMVRHIGAGALNRTVTVITPSHNTGEWLDATISSVRQQSFGDFHFIIVSDASTDYSLDIATRHAAKDDRISVLEVDCRSVSRARNEGLKIANSPFTAFLDGDDVWHEDFLKVSLEKLGKLDDSYLAVFSLFQFVSQEDGRPTTITDPSRGLMHINTVGPVDFDHYLLCDTPASTASAVVMRSAALRGHPFRQEAEMSEDYDLWLRVLGSRPGSKFYGIDEKLFDKRVCQGSLSSDAGAVFKALDRIYAEFVPQMSEATKDARWEIYQAAVSGARERGQPELAGHFLEMAVRLAQDPGFRPSILSIPDDVALPS